VQVELFPECSGQRRAEGKRRTGAGSWDPGFPPVPVEGSAQELQDSAREVTEFERCWWQCSRKRVTYGDIE